MDLLRPSPSQQQEDCYIAIRFPVASFYVCKSCPVLTPSQGSVLQQGSRKGTRLMVVEWGWVWGVWGGFGFSGIGAMFVEFRVQGWG